jgi:hypothetical protein
MIPASIPEGSVMLQRALLAAFLAVLVAGPASAILPPGTQYTIVLKGSTLTLDGQKFAFTATGNMWWEQTSGAVYFNVTSSAGPTFTGTGTMANGVKGAFATTTFDMGTSGGTAVFLGKFSKDLSTFSGKFTAGSPDRLGPAPGGFVYTSGSVKAELP